MLDSLDDAVENRGRTTFFFSSVNEIVTSVVMIPKNNVNLIKSYVN